MSVADPAAVAEAAEQRFLAELRRRVAWQADAAYGEARDEPPRRTLVDLERLVDAHGADHPERVDEWRWQIRYLRFHAAADGTLPPAFDGFVDAAFAELV